MKIKTRKYVNNQVRWLEKTMDTNLERDRKAVDQYSKTNDEWKLLHNDLIRKMERDREQFVTKADLARQTKLIIAVVAALIALYKFVIVYLIK